MKKKDGRNGKKRHETECKGKENNTKETILHKPKGNIGMNGKEKNSFERKVIAEEHRNQGMTTIENTIGQKVSERALPLQRTAAQT